MSKCCKVYLLQPNSRYGERFEIPFPGQPHRQSQQERELGLISQCTPWKQSPRVVLQKRCSTNMDNFDCMFLSCHVCISEWIHSLYFAPVLSKEFVDIQATIECGFTLKCVCDMIRTYSQMHCTDKYWQHSLIIWPVWLNGWVFVYELSTCGFESSCSHMDSFI